MAEPAARVRAPGGGRKRLAETDPELLVELKAWWIRRLVGTRCRRWSGRQSRPGTWPASDRGRASGHGPDGGADAAGLGFSLQGNTKVIEGSQHADRDAQFGYLNQRVSEHVAAGQPVISVDTKKKELVGEFKNGGK